MQSLLGSYFLFCAKTVDNLFRVKHTKTVSLYAVVANRTSDTYVECQMACSSVMSLSMLPLLRVSTFKLVYLM